MSTFPVHSQWFSKWVKGMFCLLLVFAILLLNAHRAAAQSSGQVSISSLDSGKFPSVTFYLDARANNGAFVTNLATSDLTLLEDNQSRTVSSIVQTDPGAHVIVTMNVGPVFATSDGKSTLFQKVQTALKNWAQGQATAPKDEFSLVSNSGLQSARQTDANQWVKAITDYQPDLMKAQPGTVSLSQALDLATDPTENAQMKRVILYITSSIASTTALPSLADRAVQSGARIFVWLVAPPGTSNTQSEEAFKSMAQRTGGQYFKFGGSETLPDPEIYLKQLRSIYLVSFNSSVSQSGNHKISVKIDRADLKASSNELSYSIRLDAPNPIFLSPPTSITRTWLPAANAKTTLSPASVPIQIMIEFPDGHTRTLKSSRLYVDGALADENLNAPFDRFTWSLATIEKSSKHTIRVEIVDSLGFTKDSIDLPVELLVEAPQATVLTTLTANNRLLIAGAVASAALVVSLVLALSVRKKKPARAVVRRQKDPVTQPVKIRQEKTPAANSVDSSAVTLPRMVKLAGPAPAHLIRLSESGNTIPGSAIPIHSAQITLGSDPRKANYVLDSTSVEGLHACLVIKPDGTFILSDAGSVAGTWVNYNPVSIHGVHLEHGDLIHLGRVALRFEMTHPLKIRQPKVTPYEEVR